VDALLMVDELGLIFELVLVFCDEDVEEFGLEECDNIEVVDDVDEVNVNVVVDGVVDADEDSDDVDVDSDDVESEVTFATG
jgi:hypothetical protein